MVLPRRDWELLDTILSRRPKPNDLERLLQQINPERMNRPATAPAWATRTRLSLTQ